MEIDKSILKVDISNFESARSEYKKMYDYYIAKTDAEKNYKQVDDRSNAFVKQNFIKKFLKQEVNYLLSNRITYTSEDVDAVNIITRVMKRAGNTHDRELFKNALIFGESYELAHIADEKINFKILTPLNCYIHYNEYDEIEYAFYYRKKKINNKDVILLDIYTKDDIQYFSYSSDNFKQSKAPTSHFFGEVPISICSLSQEGKDDTLYSDIFSLQDSYNTVVSNFVNETSDFRDAYMVFKNAKVDDTTAKEFKKNGIIILNSPNGQLKADVSFLMKNINAEFNKLMLDTLHKNIYEQANHIDETEKLQSNTSGDALQARMWGLTNKISGYKDVMSDVLQNRCKLIFRYFNLITSSKHDYLDIDFKFTLNLPKNDQATADIISKVGDRISNETALAQFSFITNPSVEAKKVEKEKGIEMTPEQVKSLIAGVGDE
ncbi:phage portal protein [Anaerophilus nitritogenes]|uniref:phage portal protein n=1 Tax=Anaerophilus nitritogenes TaxID=2498136 RepID=UPI00101CC99E|nr:phage portal protein [Anaerophilus nitritogenes]